VISLVGTFPSFRRFRGSWTDRQSVYLKKKNSLKFQLTGLQWTIRNRQDGDQLADLRSSTYCAKCKSRFISKYYKQLLKKTDMSSPCMNISSSVPEKLLLGHSSSWGSKRFFQYVCIDLGSYCLWRSADDQCPQCLQVLIRRWGWAQLYYFGAHVRGDAIGILVRSLTTAENFEFCAIVPLCFHDPLFIY